MGRPTALVLSASFGNGHHQVANIIAEDLENKGFEPIVSNLFGESYPTISNFTQSLLNNNFFSGSSFNKWFYYGTNKLNNKGLPQLSRYVGRKRLVELIKRNHPVFVISTFLFHSAPFLLKKWNHSIPAYTVITDYCVHPNWINPNIDHYFVCSESVKNTLLNHNINEKQITISGIPIRSQFEQSIDRYSVFEKHFLSPHKKIITILAGGPVDLKNIMGLFRQLLQNPSYQIVTICGKNDGLFEKLLPLAYQYPDSFRLFGYVEEIHKLLAVSILLITKPGGVILAEAAALKVPLILFKPLPGKETENAKYFAEKGAAFIPKSINETVSLIKKLTKNKENFEKMKHQLSNIHKTHAVSTISNYAIKKSRENNITLMR